MTSLSGQAGAMRFFVFWFAISAALFVIIWPRATVALVVLSGVMTALYIVRLPVGSNNKTIGFFMNSGLITIAAVCYAQGLRGEALRDALYERIRPIARGLLAVMYFYGIFHKINSDFLDPEVSCAVGLYMPLAAPFGLADSIAGKYLAIAATFVIETITIISLYWRRYFAVGLIFALVFHYIIPISAYSWYMDFSSLVFALYMLSMPKGVSERVYWGSIRMLYPARARWGRPGILMPGLLVVGVASIFVIALAAKFPDRDIIQLYHSVWIIIWAVVGGVAMVVIARAALEFLPYGDCPYGDGATSPRQPLWVHGFAIALLLSCLSPYVGLKTESAINMFSNLHTEGGVSNHLLLPKPPYLFDYQKDVVRIVDSSHPWMRSYASGDTQVVEFVVKTFLRDNPTHWVTYLHGNNLLEKKTIADFPTFKPNLLERKLLIFKDVDWRRPKVCTH
jgi:hypothetical protein